MTLFGEETLNGRFSPADKHSSSSALEDKKWLPPEGEFRTLVLILKNIANERVSRRPFIKKSEPRQLDYAAGRDKNPQAPEKETADGYHLNGGQADGHLDARRRRLLDRVELFFKKRFGKTPLNPAFPGSCL